MALEGKEIPQTARARREYPKLLQTGREADRMPERILLLTTDSRTRVISSGNTPRLMLMYCFASPVTA